MAHPPRTPLTVLIADPDSAQQQLLAQCLAPRFRVLFAAGLDEIRRQIDTHHPAVLLIDLDQPDNGDVRAFITQLRASPATKYMVIGIVTKHASIHDKVTGFNSGADDYVVKPVNLRSFMYRVVLLTRTRNLAS